MSPKEDFDRHMAGARGAINAAIVDAETKAKDNAHKVTIARAGEQHDLALLRQKEAGAALEKARADVEQDDGTSDEAKIAILRAARQTAVFAQGVAHGTFATLQAVKKPMGAPS